MSLGDLLGVLIELMSLPFGPAKPKTRAERMQLVLSIAFWIVVLLAIALGIWSLHSAPRPS